MSDSPSHPIDALREPMDHPFESERLSGRG